MLKFFLSSAGRCPLLLCGRVIRYQAIGKSPFFPPFLKNMKKVCSAVIFVLLVECLLHTPLPWGARRVPCFPSSDDGRDVPLQQLPCLHGSESKKERTERRTYPIKLHHAETMRWCLDCHDARNRDKLRLYNGELINFTKVTGSAGNVTEMCTGTGRPVSMGKGWDTLLALARGPTFSAPTATTLMTPNSNP